MNPILLLPALLPSALAWDLAVLDPLVLSQAPTQLEPVTLGSKVGLVLSDSAGLWVINPLTGDVLDEVPGSIADVAAASFEGQLAIALCGPDGLSITVPDGAGLSTPLLESPVVCAAVHPTDTGFATGQLGVQLYLWESLGLGEPLDTGLNQPDQALFATLDDTLAVTGLGDLALSLYSLSSGLTTPVPLPSPAAGLAPLRGELAISQPDDSLVLLLNPSTLATLTLGTLALPGPLYAGDFDGDGDQELLVFHPSSGEVGILDPDLGEEELLPQLSSVLALTVADFNQDGCDDITFTAGDGLSLYLGLGCLTAELLDQDGDGLTPADGDCDDQDDRVALGAAEICDEKDNDCDGDVDEVPNTIEARNVNGETTAQEGDIVSFSATTSTCLADATVVWTYEGQALCEEGTVGLDCELLDDGVLTLLATLVDGQGQTLDSNGLSLTVNNFDPLFLDWPPDGSILDPGEELVHALVVADVVDDTVALELLNAPPGMTLIDRDWISFRSWSPGTYGYTLRATDEDGGITELVLEIEVRSDAGSNLTCAGLAILAAGGLITFLVARAMRLMR